MKFGPVPVAEAEGAISAHSVRLDGFSVRKGARISAADVAALCASSVATIIVARPGPEDVGEDAAAQRLAGASAGPAVRVDKPFTGRSNLFATAAGVLIVRRDAVDRLNAVHESVTLATLPAFRAVSEGEMVATVKIIPYALPARTLAAALAIAAETAPLIAVAPFRLMDVGVISTLLPGLKPATVTKTVAALRKRLAPAGASVAAEASCPHDAATLADRIRDQAASGVALIIVFGASAIADRRDVIPAAIEAAGGTVEHLGMPVDPGNLLLLGRIGDVPVIGAPGCARSPKENGFDWVLQRLLAGLAVSGADIAAMGVGGLLMETKARGLPREATGSDDDGG